MTATYKTFDYSRLEYEGWLAFFFDRPATRDPKRRHEMFVADYLFIEANRPGRVVGHLTRLASGIDEVSSRFTHEQLDQGFRVMFGPDYDHGSCVTDRSVPADERIECIRSMGRLFQGSPPPLPGGSAFRWWGWLSKAFWQPFKAGLLPLTGVAASDYKVLDEESRRILDAMFETVEAVLASPDPVGRASALHGMALLHHPKGWDVLQSYILRHRDSMTGDELAWAERCRDEALGWNG